MSTAQGDTRRVRTAIVLTTLTGTAFFFAAGTSQLVASAFLDVPVDADAGVLAAAPAVAPRRREARAGEPILQRNIFDSTTGAIPWDDPPPAVVETPVEIETRVDPGDLTVPHPACEGSVRLVGAYVRRGEPDQSFAAVINATGTSLLYREGMQIDDRLVMMIERHRLVLRTAGSTLCDLNMFGTPPTTAVATAPAPVVVETPAPAGPETGGMDASDLDANIHQVSETSYTINRTLVDRLLANQAALMSAARVIPHEEDGRTVGMKIYGIRRSSLLGRLGVQNGDMLRTVNGFDLTDPNAILQAYTQLRAADHLTLQVVRRGNPISMDYQIQ
ncbi:MAG: type II secretion system protein GspC [Sandaracinus sp.]|jgi:general secretion pathway protein C